MRAFFLLISMLMIPACGVDGEPESQAPESRPEPGFSVSGDARIGVVGTL